MILTYKAPCVKLEKLENIWLQLSNVACNIKCRHCYLDCHHDIKKKNFLTVEKTENLLKQNFTDLKMIYLSGGEPFLHPKINDIIALCLKKCNLTIYSNGTLLNEKKIKVLLEIKNKYPNDINFRLSLDHFTEGRNDEYRARGVFKKVINALILLQKYNFNASIVCVNLKKENTQMLTLGFLKMFEKYNLNLTENDIRIIPQLNIGNYAKYYGLTGNKNNATFENTKNVNFDILDCKNSRVLSQDGIYCCPALVNDPRGKLGDDIKSASKNVYLETCACFECISLDGKLFC